MDHFGPFWHPRPLNSSKFIFFIGLSLAKLMCGKFPSAFGFWRSARPKMVSKRPFLIRAQKKAPGAQFITAMVKNCLKCCLGFS